MKLKTNLSGVAETLLIPLYAKARDYETRKTVLKDEIAYKIYKKLDYDFTKYDKDWKSYYGTLARAKVMDNEVKKFIDKKENALVINIGCGLDSRFNRIDNGKVLWYNIDFPEVIELREKYFPANEREINISKSIFEEDVLENIDFENKEVLVVSEGVFMYFSEEEIIKIISMFGKKIKRFEIYLDMLSKYLVGKEKIHSSVRETTAKFKYGVINGDELLPYISKLKKIKYINFTSQFFKIAPFYVRIVYPIIHYYNNRLVEYRYE